MKRLAFFLVATASFLHSEPIGFSGSSTIDFTDEGFSRSHFFTSSPNSTGNAGFHLGRTELYLDAALKKNAWFYAQIDWEPSQNPELSLAYLRFQNAFDQGSTWDIGKILNPFGLFLQKRSPQQNRMIGTPLIYDYRTHIRTDSLPASAAELLARKGSGSRIATYTQNPYMNGTSVNNGLNSMSMISQDYPTGILYYANKDHVDYYLGMTNNAMGSNESENISSTLNWFSKMTYVGSENSRLSFQIASGDYLNNRIPLAAGASHFDFRQTVFGFDFQYTRGRWNLMSELMFSSWQSPQIQEDLKSTGFYAEGQYFWNPQFYGALRYGGISFGNITLGGIKTSWDEDITRIEAGVGYYMSEDILTKFFVQTNSQNNSALDDDFVSLQVAASF